MGLLLLLLSLIFGYCLINIFFSVEKPVTKIMGSVVVGFILSGTLLYLFDLLFIRLTGSYIAGMMSFSLASFLFVLYLFMRMSLWDRLLEDVRNFGKDGPALVMLGIFGLFSAWLFYHTFLPVNGDIRVIGAWSDITYHHAYVRSVSIGKNVPVEYPYFANSPMHWHFMFNYFTGKIAQAGLNSVHALNLTSILGFTSLLMLVFQFGRQYFKSTAVGIMGPVFLLFHSSMNVFPWVVEQNGKNLISEIINKRGWLCLARFEDWGLFNLNVFVNQRHFALAIGLLVFIILVIIELREKKHEQKNISTNRHFILNFKNYVFTGVFIGITPYWNMVVTVVCICLLFLFAVSLIKDREMFFGLVLSAAIAGVLTLPQLLLIKSGDTVLLEYPRFHPGFALEHFTVYGFISYYIQTLGFKVVMLAVALLVLQRRERLDIFILALPFFLANILQFGKVLYDNNKFIICSLVFINVFAAYGIVWLYRNTRPFLKIIPVIIAITMVFAGTVDFFAVKNLPQVYLADKSSELKNWIIGNTDPKAVFATNTFIPFNDSSMMSVTLAGRKLYAVINDVDSSCDVQPRIEIIKRIYSCSGSVEEIKQLASNEEIDYIIVDNLVRENREFKLNEQALSKTFRIVYNRDGVSVYSTAE